MIHDRLARVAAFLGQSFFALSPSLSSAAEVVSPLPVRIDVDLADTLGPFKPVHRFFGCDEPNYAYAPSGRRLLGELGKVSPDAPIYFRTHYLFNSGDGTSTPKWGSTNVYTEDAAGKPVYDFAILDRIFDAYRAAGIRPYFQLGCMPEALSTQPQPYRHAWEPGKPYSDIFTGWSYPPKDYAKWEELCYQVTKHCVERYGKSEVEQWYFETWNEPNGNGKGYFHGTVEQFCKLHDFAIAGVKRALPTARVGGPDTAGDGGDFMQAFLDHCIGGKNEASGTTGTPLDFVAFHAKGSPKVVDDHVRMGLNVQLQTIDKAFAAFAARPQTKPLPIVIGEWDPEGCAACKGPQNAYRNGTMYASYTAEAFARTLELADARGVNLQGMLTWAFEFEDQPPFAGFRVLASGPIDHAVLNVFRFLGQLHGDRVRVASDHGLSVAQITHDGVRDTPDVSALATRARGRAAVLMWHYHDDDLAGPAAAVTVALDHLPPGVTQATLGEWRIDAEHGNAFPLWLSMGSPLQPTAEQVAALQRAAADTSLRQNVSLSVSGGRASVVIDLPRQGVSLLALTWDEKP